eukprot:2947067-Prorocentrum_lima.AAC.1
MWSQIAHQVGRKDFEEFGRRIGLGNKLIKRELDEFVKEKPLVQVLIDRSFLSEELKKADKAFFRKVLLLFPYRSYR